MAENNVIGSKNDLPWYIPADLKHFKEITTGHVVIMGRKTFESIVNRLGRALPNRRNIVMTRDRGFKPVGAEAVESFDEALKLAANEEEVFILGGAQVYASTLAKTDRIYLTEVHESVDGDVTFPAFRKSEWREVVREDHSSDGLETLTFSWVILERIHP